ncbi:helix-turn-helix transcriptional regulator [Pontibacter sp. Tf4]|uniref:helix-turn-helix domain-containing protein n=1 Tax=Pontibacter sp. Tf4 TaxID=2761620 RepID=UPI0016254D94|nr:helix-turn-helix transcriptional regulator [Pontibacter sp. Tf4]MBB6609680.1 helix-turn-helix transcriptional regulator [Pontibacter sp. Tf4]
MERKELFDEEGLRLFAEHLKQLRKSKGVSQEELSYRSGLVLSQIARIETARTNPRLSTLFQIARGLDIELAELFSFRLQPKQQS